MVQLPGIFVKITLAFFFFLPSLFKSRSNAMKDPEPDNIRFKISAEVNVTKQMKICPCTY